MIHRRVFLLPVLLALCAAAPVHADLLGNIKNQFGGGSLGLPAIGGSNVSNAAGVLQYCVQNNYLNPDKAQSVKDRLLGKFGLAQQPKDSGYRDGLAGMLSGGGRSVDLSKLKDQLKEKACDYVLQQGQALL